MNKTLYMCSCRVAKVTHMGTHIRHHGTEDVYFSPGTLSARCKGCHTRFSVPIEWPVLQKTVERANMTTITT